ncbi:choice-of-anchor Q domain-containing protein [Marilutibacter chinensis]|uniref:Parallel beta helix pectate lyase-like protein n=1 Tax=Marilutibacter chinensis TaxID=2912247 RepID=A0ABS9HPS6_9GAMM|nr:choice-of-anchor Q domain-containing protein [Lysobacter chinensis]MCF7220941.1 hypothetical protein [Lysobacter chinensis]
MKQAVLRQVRILAAIATGCIGSASTIVPPVHAATFHVRVDGGDATQCSGLADAPYPGAGNGRACAWNHPFVALPPSAPARIRGGDTLIVRPGGYEIGPGAPDSGNCAATGDCALSTLPGGPSPQQPTRLLGGSSEDVCSAPPQLWASAGNRAVIRLDGIEHVEIGCLEITDHSACIVGYPARGDGAREDLRCAETPGTGAGWGRDGIVARDAGNVLLRDLDIHGMAGNGIRAGRLRDWTLRRVRLHANGWAGWDGNVGSKAEPDSGNQGHIRFLDSEIAWNGCAERHPERTITGCWAQQQGGYGDGLGTARTGGDWLFENVRVHHNTSDGLDLLYLDGSGSVTLRRVLAFANAGNQVKTSGPMRIENSILAGSCGYFADLQRAEPERSIMTGSDHCRAMGNTLSVSFTGDSRAVIRNNAISGEGDCLLVTTGGSSRARAQVVNNLFVGGVQWQPDAAVADHRIEGEPTCGHYTVDGDAQLEFERNLFWQVKPGSCPAGSLCDTPPGLQPSDDEVLRWSPAPGSPLIDAGKPLDDLETDYSGRARDGTPDIGAIEARPRD